MRSTTLERALMHRDVECINDMMAGWTAGLSPTARETLGQHDHDDLKQRIVTLIEDRIHARENPEEDIDEDRRNQRDAARRTALRAALDRLTEREKGGGES